MIDVRYAGVFGWEVFDAENGLPLGFFDDPEAAFSLREKLTDARNNVTIASSNEEDNNIETGAAFCKDTAKT